MIQNGQRGSIRIPDFGRGLKGFPISGSPFLGRKKTHELSVSLTQQSSFLVVHESLRNGTWPEAKATMTPQADGT